MRVKVTVRVKVGICERVSVRVRMMVMCEGDV